MVVCLAMMVVWSGCSRPEAPIDPAQTFYQNGLQAASLPETITEADFPDLSPGDLAITIGFAGQDLSGKDISLLSLGFLSHWAYDLATQWPTQGLPAGFEPDRWLQMGMNPGLGIRDIHQSGSSGAGLVVAVIDKPIPQDHGELANRLIYHEVVPGHAKNAIHHFHGLAAASILAGFQSGILPDATLHYFAVPDDGQTFPHYQRAIDMIREFNQTVSNSERIRVVSISDGLSPEDPLWESWETSLAAAENEGLIVVYINNAAEHHLLWGGCPPYLNREEPANYQPATLLQGGTLPEDFVIIPGDFRTTALHIGSDAYMYWGDGGFAWAIPYVAGLCGLALAAGADMNGSEMMDAMAQSAFVGDSIWRVVQPRSFLNLVTSR